VSDMAYAADSRAGSAGMVTVAELLRRASRGRPDIDPPAPPPPSDQVWVGTLLRREGLDPQEAFGTSTAEHPHSLKKVAVTAGALLAVGALGVSAVIVTKATDDGQALLDRLSPAQLGQLPLDAAAAAAGAGANLFTALVPGVLPEAAALISGAVTAAMNATNGLPFVLPGLPGAPAATGAPSTAGAPPTSAVAGGGAAPSGGGAPGGAAPASSGPVNNTVGTAGRTVGGTASNLGSALPQPVGQPVQQLGGAVSSTSTGVATTADSVLAPVTQPVGSVLGGLAR
jgi:hypothetical protein